MGNVSVDTHAEHLPESSVDATGAAIHVSGVESGSTDSMAVDQPSKAHVKHETSVAHTTITANDVEAKASVESISPKKCTKEPSVYYHEHWSFIPFLRAEELLQSLDARGIRENELLTNLKYVA